MIAIKLETVHRAPTLELTALIDIVFIVIVFLLLTANVRLLDLPVTLSQSGGDLTVATAKQAPQVITLMGSADVTFAINDSSYLEWSVFSDALSTAFDSDDVIHIAADKTVPADPLLKTLSRLKILGLTNVSLLMEPAYEN